MTQPPPAARRDGPVFWRLASAHGVSAFGTAVTTVAMPLVAVLELKADTFETSLVSAAAMCAWLLFGLPAGVLVHRLPLRPVLVAADLIRALTLLSIPVAVFLDALSLGQLVVAAFVLSVASVVFDVGYSTYLPAVVSKDRLAAGNSILQGSESVSQVAGPGLGGSLVQAFGAAYSLIADVVSYVVSAALLLTVPAPHKDRADQTKRNVFGEMWEGIEFVRRHPVIRPFVLVGTGFNFATAAFEAITAVFLIRTVHASSLTVGLLIACMGLGGVVGAAVTTPLIKWLGTTRAALVPLILSPVSALLMPLAGRGFGAVLFGLGSFGWGACTVTFAIIARTYRQTAVAPELLPRVMATVRFVSWGVFPIGALLAGVLGQTFGNRTALLVFALCTLLIPVPVLCSPIRRSRDLLDVETDLARV
ncbi:MFS transporter [Streptomyces seoulensis]|uniref:MFS transporter n=1 Tax=Streptomyces seoulensis TaxID=73044 RepID=A0A5P2GJE1_STRSO|nr:MFS transporter [Streptomyces seoulensis]QKW30103.1 MFS transporter [Streptomyces seoulensis]